jgi:hypothetical protein
MRNAIRKWDVYDRVNHVRLGVVEAVDLFAATALAVAKFHLAETHMTLTYWT